MKTSAFRPLAPILMGRRPLGQPIPVPAGQPAGLPQPPGQPTPFQMQPSAQQISDLAEQLRRDGAIVTVQIAAPGALAAAGAQQGASQTVKGMVDTGASISTVSDQVAMAAGLQQTGSVPLSGVGGTSERPIFAAAITLPEYNVTVDPIEIAGVTLPFGGAGFDILIGRDVLKALRLDYRGPQGAFGLTQDGGPATPAAEALGVEMSTTTMVLIGGGVVAGLFGTLFALDVL